MEYQNSFGYWLRLKRKALDLTRAGLADRVGCSTATIRKLETEERRPSEQIVLRLAEIFNISLAERTAFLRFARGDLRSVPSEIQENFPWQASTRSPRSNLPAATTTLIGREKEIAAVSEYILRKDIRLINLIGPPGIGKTRLSIEAARETRNNFPDGVFFVALAPLDDPSLIAPAVVHALDYGRAMSVPASQQLAEGIGEKRILLVLDNCEHLIEDVAPLASTLLSACSSLKIIATSREPLCIHGEWIYSVPALDVPKESLSINMEIASEFSALTLFTERARAVRHDFALNADNIRFVASICAQLDGLPLAIELLAARMRLMSPKTLLERMSAQFILSADGMRSLPARQKTLHNAINWSYNLLTEEEKKLFVRLSVFAGSFTLDAVESIFTRMNTSKSKSDLIALLLDKSLLQRTFDEHGEMRFALLDTIHQFALDRMRSMGIEAEACDGHLEYYLDLAEQADREIHRPRQVEWLDRLGLEHENFLKALDWCVSKQKTETALRLLGALGWAWDVRGHYIEARSWFDKVRTLPEINAYPAQYASLLNHLARHCWMLGDMREASILLEESREIWLKLGSAGEWGLAVTIRWLGAVAFWGESDQDVAISYFEQDLEYYRKHGDQHGLAVTIFYLGRVKHYTSSSLGLYEQSLNLFRQLGDLYWTAIVLQHIGRKFQDEGKFQKARLYLTQCLAMYEELGFKEGIAEGLLDIGHVSRHEGDYDQAEEYYQQSRIHSHEYGLTLDEGMVNLYLGIVSLHRNDFRLAGNYLKEFHRSFHQTNEKLATSFLLHGLAAVAVGMNQPEQAARLYGGMESLMISCAPNVCGEFDRYIQIAREQLGEAAFETLADEGRLMSLEQAVAHAVQDGFA
jgi:predicted ATPase/DNA-binding XRE family transcriptional regulator